MTRAADDLRTSLRRLPKTDLHLHVLGALRPATTVELARRRGSALLARAERAGETGYAFVDLSDFVRFYFGLFELVLDAGEFERVTWEALEDAASQGVRYAELRWTPTSHIARGADEDAMFEGIASGCREARGRYGIESRLIVDFPRSLPLETAEAALAVALRQRARGVTAFDVAGDEAAVASDPAFAPCFDAARHAGLHVTAHAGEAAGPASVRGALDLYHARRIGHGTRSVEDPRLVRRLANEGVVLEVCPSSNVALGVVPSISDHPVTSFLAEGVPCVVATDDPTLFATDLGREYVRLHREAGLGFETLRRMAATGFDAAFLEDAPSGRETRERLDGWRDEAIAWSPPGAADDPDTMRGGGRR